MNYIIKRGENCANSLLRKLQKSGRPVSLYGAGLCGKQYLHLLQNYGIDVECFFDDDKQKHGTYINGLEVKNPLDLKKENDKTVIISAYDPSRIYERIKQISPLLTNHVVISDFYLFDNNFDYYNYYINNYDKIKSVYDSLSDEKSKVVMRNLLQYKITRESDLIKSIRDDISEQYFSPDIIQISDHEDFWDLGAYVGDTVNMFLDIVNNDYKSIVALEPDKKNYDILSYNMKKIKGNIVCYPYGVGEVDGNAFLNSYSSMTSFISEEGDTNIEIHTVDSLAKGRNISFLKADIEGYEKPMLKGALKSIQRCTPKLAIAVYHKKEDIFEIPLMIKKLNSDYKLFMRHYTNSSVDTVLYAV